MQTPRYLRPGDTVAVMAPASWLHHEELAEGLRILREEWNLNVVEGDTLHAVDGPFAGSDDQRRAELQRFLDNPDIRAILVARGGYGCYRLVDGLDLTGLLAHPKWLVGFSDVTVLLSLFYKHGLVSLHGIMPRQFGPPERAESLETLRRCLFGKIPPEYAVLAHPLNRSGRAIAPLAGGNLTLLANSIGTPTDLDFTNTVLFIEDIDETLFSLDRMMNQLRRSGKLERLAGLVVGQFTDMQVSVSLPFGKDAFGIIAEAVADYTYPVLFDFPAGHVDRNLALPIGRTVELQVGPDGGKLLF